MSFTFIVETGDIVPGANSFASVEEADDYLSQNIHVAEDWAALSEETKQKLLAWSTRYMDQRARWNGRPVAENQSVRWPRIGVKNIDGFHIPLNVIPTQLKSACIELARYLIDDDRSTERPQDGLKSLKVDVIELVFKDGYTLPEVPSEINNMLLGLGTLIAGPSSFGRIRRA